MSKCLKKLDLSEYTQSVDALVELRNKIDSALAVARVKEKSLQVKVAENIGKIFMKSNLINSDDLHLIQNTYYKLIKLDYLANQYYITYIRVEVWNRVNDKCFGGKYVESYKVNKVITEIEQIENILELESIFPVSKIEQLLSIYD